ncbi:hypothetical protein [Nocardioides sp. AN3]
MLRSIVSNAVALEVTDFTARYVDEAGATGPSGRWIASVDMTWRFGRYDSASTHEEVAVSFSSAAGAASISEFGGGPQRTPLWLRGPVHVDAGSGVLALGPDTTTVDRYARLARRAVPIVGRVIRGWHGPLVVEVPRSEADLDKALGTAVGTYVGVAAVTASVDGSGAANAPVHVFVNPEVMTTLDTRGAQIVLSHEATHAATKAATDHHRPMWLTEGFADYVALRDVRLPLTTTAGQIIAQVRKSGPPDHLPEASDFNSHSASFGAEYEAAWLACRVVAERAGERGLVRLYDAVGAGQDVETALRKVVGVGTRGLTRMWQSRLSDLAG